VASSPRRRKNRLSTLPPVRRSPAPAAPDTSPEPRMSPAGTQQGSAHNDLPKPAAPTCHPDGTPFTRENPDIDPATGELRGGWRLPADIDQRPRAADEPEPPAPESPVAAPAAEPVAPRPMRDTRLDGMNALQRTGARVDLPHRTDVAQCHCWKCWQKRGAVHKSNRGVGPSRGGESRSSWNHAADERPTGSASEQVQEVLDTEF